MTNKKIIAVTTIFLAVFVFINGVNILNAQTASPSAATATPAPTPEVFNFEKAYKDYVFITDQYNKAHAEYLLAKAQYTQAKTLASQTKARDATAMMIERRDEVMASYLTALRLKLSENEGIGDTIRNGIYSRIDNDVSWWNSHKSKINSAGTLSDLEEDSQNAAEHFPVTEALSYEILSNIALGRELVLRNDLNLILSRTKNKISQIRGNGDHDTTNAERWVVETDQKLTRSLDKEIEAGALITAIAQVDTRNRNKGASYNQIILKLNESTLFLKEANGYMKEVIKDLKVKR